MVRMPVYSPREKRLLLGLIGLSVFGYVSLFSVVWYRVVEFHDLLRDSLLLSLVPLPLVGWILRKQGRNESTGRIFWGTVLLAWTGFFLMGTGSLILLNGWLDNSPVRVRTVPVLKKYTAKRFSRVVYYVEASMKGPVGSSYKFPVSEQRFHRIQPSASCIRIQLRDGLLGYRWIESFRVRSGLESWNHSQRLDGPERASGPGDGPGG